MTETKQKIIDEFLKSFDYNSYYENDKFMYWIKESYRYDSDEFTREEFKEIQDYVVKYGDVPASKKTIQKKGEWELKKIDEDRIYGTHSQLVLRYSKTYDSLEYYEFNTRIKSPYNTKSKRILVLSKKRSLLKVNTKNYVLINGNRWLSMKNWSGFYHRNTYKKEFINLLMSTMLGGKEWVLNLDLEGSNYISNKNARKANSIEEAIELECGAKPAKIFKKFFDTNNIIHLYSLIEPNKVHDITNFIKRNRAKLKFILDSSYEEKSRDLLYYYFLTKDNRCDKHIVMDYLRMLSNEGKKVNLDISSFTTINRKHDELSRKIREKNAKKNNLKKKRLRVSKMFPAIKSLPNMEVEQIRTVKRLDYESEILHHCVHGYTKQINSGSCCIYSLVYNNQRYTLQINANNKKRINPLGVEEEYHELSIAQLKGKYNCDAPESIRKCIDKMCKDYDILPLEKSNIRFRPNEFEAKEHKKEAAAQRVQIAAPAKVEVTQIGEKILDTVIAKSGVVVHGDLPF